MARVTAAMRCSERKIPMHGVLQGSILGGAWSQTENIMMPWWMLAGVVTSVLAVRPEVKLPDGTPVEVRLLRVIASDISTPGEPVHLAVAADVAVDKLVLLAKGTPVAGVIVEAAPSRVSGRPARLIFTIHQTSSVSGQTIRLRTSPDKAGEQRASVTGGRSALLLWAAPGQIFHAFVDGDYSEAAPRAQPPVPRSDVLTNEDVLQLLSAGIGEEVVIAKIRGSRTAFRVGADDLIHLKTAGVSDRIMLAMIDAAHGVIRVPKSAIK
jgi:hypothetical protein